MASRGGTGTAAWCDGEKPMRQRIVNVWQQTGLNKPFGTLLWHQGEHDLLNLTFDTWSSKLFELITYLKEQLILETNAKIVVGSLAQTTPERIVFNKNLAKFASLRKFGFVSSQGLTMQGTSTSHFSGISYKTLGYRYFNTWNTL